MRLQAVLHGISRSEADRRGDVLLERVGLVGAANRRVGTYSGGMRRRLDLALSLVHEPSVLFLDEPTTGLDPTSRTALWEEVRRLNAEGTTVFLTTQYLEEADELAGARRHHRQRPHRAGRASRRRSRPASVPTPSSSPSVPTTRCAPPRCSPGSAAAAPPRPARSPSASTAAPASLSGALRALEDAGIAVEHVELDAPSLDDVFADATGRRLEGAEGGDGAPRRSRDDHRRRARPTARSASARARRWPRPPGSPAVRSGAPSACPSVWMPGLLFPMFIAAVNSSTMGEAVDFLPGFEGVDSLLQFLLPASITQSVLFGGLNAGSDTATDIQNGFFDRLLASPVARTSILVGRLMGASVTGAGQAVVFIVGVRHLRRARWPAGCRACSSSSSTRWCWRW